METKVTSIRTDYYERAHGVKPRGNETYEFTITVSYLAQGTWTEAKRKVLEVANGLNAPEGSTVEVELEA